jgi:hypothetical protein
MSESPRRRTPNALGSRARSPKIAALTWVVAVLGLVFLPWMVMVAWEDGAPVPHPFLPLSGLGPTTIRGVGLVAGLLGFLRIRYDRGLLRWIHGLNAYGMIVALCVMEGIHLKLSLAVAPFLFWMALVESESDD